MHGKLDGVMEQRCSDPARASSLREKSRHTPQQHPRSGVSVKAIIKVRIKFSLCGAARQQACTLAVSSRVLPSCISAKSVTLRVLRRLRDARCSPSAGAPSSLPGHATRECVTAEASSPLTFPALSTPGHHHHRVSHLAQSQMQRRCGTACFSSKHNPMLGKKT